MKRNHRYLRGDKIVTKASQAAKKRERKFKRKYAWTVCFAFLFFLLSLGVAVALALFDTAFFTELRASVPFLETRFGEFSVRVAYIGYFALLATGFWGCFAYGGVVKNGRRKKEIRDIALCFYILFSAVILIVTGIWEAWKGFDMDFKKWLSTTETAQTWWIKSLMASIVCWMNFSVGKRTESGYERDFAFEGRNYYSGAPATYSRHVFMSLLLTVAPSLILGGVSVVVTMIGLFITFITNLLLTINEQRKQIKQEVNGYIRQYQKAYMRYGDKR